MEIVYSRACGVDVHKAFIVAVICISESVKPKYIKKRFSAFNNQLIKFREWLIENNCHNVWNLLESTISLYTIHYIVRSSYIPEKDTHVLGEFPTIIPSNWELITSKN